MNTIERTCDLPRGLFRMYQHATEAEARSSHAIGYLYQSHVIVAWYVFVQVDETGSCATLEGARR